MKTKVQTDIHSSIEGYNLIAPTYEQSPWNHFWDANEVPLVSEKISKWKHSVVLDAGCGTGRYSKLLQSSGNALIGLDTSREMLDIYSRRCPGAKVIRGSISKSAIGDQTVDHILCTRVLSHSRDLRTVIREFARILRVGGSVLISDIHPDHRYNETSFKKDKRSVRIETYKHSLSVFRSVCSSEGFEIKGLKEFNFEDLLDKPEKGFAKIRNTPREPIFWLASLQLKGDSPSDNSGSR